MTQAGPIDPSAVHAAIGCVALTVLLAASLRDLAVCIIATVRRRISRFGSLPYACAIAAGMGVTLFGS